MRLRERLASLRLLLLWCAERTCETRSPKREAAALPAMKRLNSMLSHRGDNKDGDSDRSKSQPSDRGKGAASTSSSFQQRRASGSSMPSMEEESQGSKSRMLTASEVAAEQRKGTVIRPTLHLSRLRKENEAETIRLLNEAAEAELILLNETRSAMLDSARRHSNVDDATAGEHAALAYSHLAEACSRFYAICADAICGRCAGAASSISTTTVGTGHRLLSDPEPPLRQKTPPTPNSRHRSLLPDDEARHKSRMPTGYSSGRAPVRSPPIARRERRRRRPPFYLHVC